MKFSRFFIAILIIIYTAGCDSSQVFEKNKSVNGKEWFYADTLQFTVPVEDVTSIYDLYLNVRHSQQYQWRNLWVILHTELPSGEKTDTRIDLPLAEADGRWYGKCTGDICHVQIPIQKNTVFPDTGRYTFSIEQNMRQNPLKHVIGMGLRIERSGVTN